MADIEDKKKKQREKENAYMREYIAKSKTIECDVCGRSYKEYKKYKHFQTKKHQLAMYKKESEEASKNAKQEVLDKVSELEQQVKDLQKIIANQKKSGNHRVK